MEGVAVCDAAENIEKSLAVRREGDVYARGDHEFPDGSNGARRKTSPAGWLWAFVQDEDMSN